MPSRTPQGKRKISFVPTAPKLLASVVHVGYFTLKFTYCQIVFECDFKVVDNVECGHNGDFIAADNASALFDSGTFC